MTLSRREGMGKMFAGLVGGSAALAGARGGGNASQTMPSDFAKYAAPSNAYPRPIELDPMEKARYKAVEPLRRKIEDIEGYGANPPLSSYFRSHTSAHHFDIFACKSTSAWFKQHVVHEREKSKLKAIDSLRQEMNKLMTSPLDGLESTAREAILGFLAEIQK